MKIDFRILQDIGSPRQNTGVRQGAGDFAAILQRALEKKAVTEVETFSTEPTPIPERPVSLAGEILSLLEDLAGASESKDLVAELKARSVALEQELAQVPQGSGRKLLEEIMLLGVVEAEKWHQGRYS